jgi:uncharacterized membrane protein (UPF0127 family)
MKARNVTKNQLIADKLEFAENVMSRMIGLLGRDSLPAGSGLLIKPCKGIHTFGMKYEIDALFLGKDNRIVATIKRIPPNRLTRIYFSAVSVLELPAGTIELTSTKVGDGVEIG